MNKLQRIEEMEKQIAALKAEVEKENEPMFPVIDEGDDYRFTTVAGKVNNVSNVNSHSDKAIIAASNAFTDEKQAQACADYLKNRFWFIRKAIEFSDGYEFVEAIDNYYAYYDCVGRKWVNVYHVSVKTNNIYMTKENSSKFCEWLNKHKPNGWD